MTWVTTSGGVKMAATMKMIRMAYFCLLRSICAVTRPSLARKKAKRGNSKMMPKAKSSLLANFRYSRILGKALMLSLEKPIKNLKPNGNTTK